MTPVCARANVLPIVGCPAIGISFIGREDAHPNVGAGRFGGEDERALGEVHLARDALHLRGVQPARIGEDGELIADEGFTREDVVVKV